ncbi:MAG: hypothetical protein L0241_19535 [Planctomycetia bacterium]|nr:hypothetical protein [Planctomycetia bacterium]
MSRLRTIGRFGCFGTLSAVGLANPAGDVRVYPSSLQNREGHQHLLGEILPS